MQNRHKAIRPPDLLLILGTDASGKNYVTNFIVDMLEKSGHSVEKRDGWFAEAPTDVISSEGKGQFDLLKEKIFLVTFPLTRCLMPFLLNLLIKKDLVKFKGSDKNVIVISHTPLRILAFYLGHTFDRKEDIRLPLYLDATLRAIAPVTRARTIVLDIADDIRKSRIASRLAEGNADNFDQYMAKDSIRSERIESFLVWLGIRYLNAVIIENNDLDDATLSAEIHQAFDAFRKN